MLHELLSGCAAVSRRRGRARHAGRSARERWAAASCRAPVRLPSRTPRPSPAQPRSAHCAATRRAISTPSSARRCGSRRMIDTPRWRISPTICGDILDQQPDRRATRRASGTRRGWRLVRHRFAASVAGVGTRAGGGRERGGLDAVSASRARMPNARRRCAISCSTSSTMPKPRRVTRARSRASRWSTARWCARAGTSARSRSSRASC